LYQGTPSGVPQNVELESASAAVSAEKQRLKPSILAVYVGGIAEAKP
jgi:hypothetical protein